MDQMSNPQEPPQLAFHSDNHSVHYLRYGLNTPWIPIGPWSDQQVHGTGGPLQV